jgi:hypothetical protein
MILESVTRPLMDEIRALRMERQVSAPQQNQPSIVEALTVLGTLNNHAQSQTLQMMQMMSSMLTGKALPIPGATDDDDDSGDMISKATSGIGEGLGRALLGAFTQPQQQPRPPQAPPPRPTLAPPPPTPNPRPEPMPAACPIPPEIRAALEPMAANLRPMLPMLKMFTNGLSSEDAAAALDEKIDSTETAEGLVLLAQQVHAHGAAALEWISPDLATPYWTETIKHLGARIARAFIDAENQETEA